MPPLFAWGEKFFDIIGGEFLFGGGIQQFDSRFGKQNVLFMQQLSVFTPSSLLDTDRRQIKSDDIRDICGLYGVDACQVARELADFTVTYRLLSMSKMFDHHDTDTEDKASTPKDQSASEY